jgi:hypothetical protein
VLVAYAKINLWDDLSDLSGSDRQGRTSSGWA